MREDQLVAGRYELEELPIMGAMGQVFPGYDPLLDRRIMVKRMHTELTADPELVERFEREARLTARVRHPGIPAVLDYGSDDDGPYLVLQPIDGHTLQELIDENHPLSTAWAAAIGVQICSILEHTHSASLVHRDLKPSNILLGTDGAISIVDFGVAVLVGASRLSTLTRTGQVVGASAYQAPERRLGIESPLTDLYAVGQVMAHLNLLTPRPSESIMELVDELTASLPQDRPQTARAVVERLTPLLGHLVPLPGFVPDPSGVRAGLTAYTDFAPASPSPGLASATIADLPHLRRRAERFAASGRLRQALDLLNYLIDIANAAGVPVALDMRWDRARWLFEAGDASRLAADLPRLSAELAERLGAPHPVVASARLMLAQALASRGQVRLSLAVLDHLSADLAIWHGGSDPRTFPVRLELGIQLAVAGDVDEGNTVLRALADHQRERLGPHHPDLAVTLDALHRGVPISR